MEDGGSEGGNWEGLSLEVLDMIFKYLPVPDLLSCSVVSKNWKKAARDVLKRSRECYAHIRCIPQDIQVLNKMIYSTDIMQMINGLHIRNERRPTGNIGLSSIHRQLPSHRRTDVARIFQSGKAELILNNANKRTILAVLGGQWQYLDLDVGWEHSLRLHESLLLREVISATSDSLQKLVIGKWTDWKFIPCCGTPFMKLKVIQAQRVEDLKNCSEGSLSNFAPNLDKIVGPMMNLDVFSQVERFVLERLKNIKVSFERFVPCLPVLWGRAVVPQVERREALNIVSNLHRLDLQRRPSNGYRSADEQILVKWNAFVCPIVLRSLNTLEELRMNTLDFYTLSMESHGLVFPNLRLLSLATHWNVTKTNEISILKNLNLRKMCPKLEQVELTEERCFRDLKEEVIPAEEFNELDQSGMPIRIDLTCRDVRYNHEYLTFFSTIYPNINKLRILELRSVDDYDMSKIFWDLPSLEYLEISVPYPLRDIDFDIEAFLSGINIEEAQLNSLRSGTPEDMLNLCLVPIRPSLLNAKNLKELKITVETRNLNAWDAIGHSWVTEVTENLPQRFVRNLKVTIDANERLCDRIVCTRAFTWLRANQITA